MEVSSYHFRSVVELQSMEETLLYKKSQNNSDFESFFL